MAADPQRSLNLAARLNATQQRERRETETSWLEDALAQEAEAPLLELPTRSYTQSEPTEEDRERERQRGMTKTLKRFVSPGGESLGAETQEETPRPSRQEPPVEVGREEQPPPELSRAQRLRQSVQRDRAQAQAIPTSTTVSDQQQNVRRLQRLWRILEGVEAVTLVGALVAILQLQIQVVNKYFFKRSVIPPSSFAEDVGCGCITLAAGVGILLFFIFAFFPFLMAWMIASTPGDVIRTFLEEMLGRLFG